MTPERLDGLKERYRDALPSGPHWRGRAVAFDEITVEALPLMRRNGLTRDFDNSSHIGGASGRDPRRARVQLFPLLAESFRWLAQEDEYGDPVGYRLADVLYSKASIEHAYMVQRLAAEMRLLDADVVEIGGGYGGLCKALVRFARGHVRYAIYDLGTTALLALAYLEATLDVPVSERAPAPVAVLPHTEIGAREDGSADLVIASRSLFELTTPVANAYLRHVRRILRPGGLFVSVARAKVSDPDAWVTRGLSLRSDEPWPMDGATMRLRIYQR